jgi:dTDP-4-dehydrorhamnose reductase
MKLLITGSHGQVGSEVTQLASKNGIQVAGLSHQELDITQYEEVLLAVEKNAPDYIINCAAYTAVDKAESESETAFAVNYIGSENLAKACAYYHLSLLHISTDYVFDGTLKRPYSEIDQPAPINIYGLSKWKGEEAIRDHCPQHIILRTSGVFGMQGHNIVKIFLRLAKEQEVMRVVADQYTCPTPAADIAEVILSIVQQTLPQTMAHSIKSNSEKNSSDGLFGTFHYCGAEITSWHEFATELVNIAEQYHSLKVKNIEAIQMSDYPTPAKRPAYSVLDCKKLLSTFGLSQRSWKSGLELVLNKI